METTERDEELEGCPSDTGEIGRASVCEGCPGRALCLSQGQADPEQEKLDLRMKAIAHKILVLSGKGGVGKSSVAANLAVALSRKGKKVALLDVDICGPSIPKLMNVEGAQVIASDYGWIPPKDPVHNIPVMSVQFLLGHPDAPVVWRGPRKTSMIKRFLKDTFWGRLDYLIVDTPPGTSDEHLSTITALKNAKPDGAVIVTTPQKVSLVTINKELSFCKKLKLPVLGLIENMSGFVCPCCEECTDIFCRDGGAEELAQQQRLPFLGRIPLDPRMGLCAERGESVLDKHPQSPCEQAFAAVVDALCK